MRRTCLQSPRRTPSRTTTGTSGRFTALAAACGEWRQAAAARSRARSWPACSPSSRTSTRCATCASSASSGSCFWASCSTTSCARGASVAGWRRASPSRSSRFRRHRSTSRGPFSGRRRSRPSSPGWHRCASHRLRTIGPGERSQDSTPKAATILLCGLLTYQPAAMFFWVFTAVEILRPGVRLDRAARTLAARLGVAAVAMAGGLVVTRLGVHFYGGVYAGRTELVRDLQPSRTSGAVWREPLVNAFNVFELVPSKTLAVAVALVAASRHRAPPHGDRLEVARFSRAGRRSRSAVVLAQPGRGRKLGVVPVARRAVGAGDAVSVARSLGDRPRDAEAHGQARATARRRRGARPSRSHCYSASSSRRWSRCPCRT